MLQQGGVDGRPGAALRRRGQLRQVAVRRGGLLRRRRRAPGARRVRLRQGVPRRALLPRGPAHADRADQPGDGAELRRASTCWVSHGATDAGIPIRPLRPRPPAALGRQGDRERRRRRRARPRGLGSVGGEGRCPRDGGRVDRPRARDELRRGPAGPGQPARDQAHRSRPGGGRRARPRRRLRAEDRAGHRRAPVRRAARPLRDAQRRDRAGVHRPGRDGARRSRTPARSPRRRRGSAR